MIQSSDPIEHLTDRMAEDAVLVSAFADPSVIDRAGDRLAGADFSDRGKGHLWETLKTIRDSRIGWSLPLLLAELERHEVRQDLRSGQKLAETFRLVNPEVKHFDEYAARVRELARKRRQFEIFDQGREKLLDRRAKSADVAAWMESQLQAIGHETGAGVRSINEAAADWIADTRKPREASRSIMSGLESHDRSTGGWQPGELVILAARPAAGKTAAAMQFATYNASKGRPVLFASLEMADRELVARILCGNAGVDSRVFRTGRQQPDHIERVEEAARDIEGMPLRVWSPPAAKLPQIRAVARAEKATNGLSLLVVDYLQLIDGTNPRESRYEAITAISRGLKQLAKELDVPILCLAQLNREADGSTPKLSHLRDSGAIEQDADAVLFLHKTGTDAGTKLIIGKHRHAETGQISLRWDASQMRFIDPAAAEIAIAEAKAQADFGGWNEGGFYDE